MTLIDTPTAPAVVPDAQLDQLVAEAIGIIREVTAECESPVLLFSGGKDSAVLLHLAVQSRKPDLVVRLLTTGADAALADERGRTPLHAAAELGLEDILIKLLNVNAPLAVRDRDGRTALDLALTGGHKPAVHSQRGKCPFHSVTRPSRRLSPGRPQISSATSTA